MVLKEVFENIDFANRYQSICQKHNDFEHCMSGSNKKKYLEILKSIDNTVNYSSKDKTFKYSFKYKNHILDMILTLHGGMVETHLNYIKDGEWFMYNRFDGYAKELNSNFNRDLYNVPKYSTFQELEKILKEIFSIYEDLKIEFIKQFS